MMDEWNLLGGNHEEKISEAITDLRRRGLIPDGAALGIDIFHNKGCPIMTAAGPCNCAPEVVVSIIGKHYTKPSRPAGPPPLFGRN